MNMNSLASENFTSSAALVPYQCTKTQQFALRKFGKVILYMYNIFCSVLQWSFNDMTISNKLINHLMSADEVCLLLLFFIHLFNLEKSTI